MLCPECGYVSALISGVWCLECYGVPALFPVESTMVRCAGLVSWYFQSVAICPP